MKKVLCLKHVDFEGPALFEKLFADLGYSIATLNAWEDPLPKKYDFEVLLVMGGPMSVNDDDYLPWLFSEKQFITNAIWKGKKVIGVCLGAQIIASVLGATVYPGTEKEIGWYPVHFKNQSYTFLFHWHGETFSLPRGAVLLASSAAYKNQIFSYKENVLAIQCHMEMDKNAIEKLIENCGDDLAGDRFVMSSEQLIQGVDLYGADAYKVLNEMVVEFLKKT
jgi:GMP synthase-like glutamine amidotransferase